MARVFRVLVVIWMLLTAPVVAFAEEDSALQTIAQRFNGSSFLVVNVCDFRHGCRGRDDSETGLVKYQVDLEYDVVRIEGYEQYGYGYLTIPVQFRSFWDLFSRLPGSRSAPFLETNYQPGVEVSYVAPGSVADYLAVRAGVLHQSNGMGDIGGKAGKDDSRSWNRAYAGAHMELPSPSPRLSLSVDAWAWKAFRQERVKAWGAQNIGTFVGVAEGSITAALNLGRWTDWILKATARERSGEIEFRWRLKSKGILLGPGNTLKFDLVAHCYRGRGERLIEADRLSQSCYAGVGF